MNPNIERIMLSPSTNIRQAMIVITDAPLWGVPPGIALVVDKQRHLFGVVTDGDIRRALVKDVSIDAPVESIMIRDPITVPKGLTESEMLELARQKVKATERITDVRVNQIIVVDKDDRVDDVLNFFELWRSTDFKYKPVCIVGLGFVGLTLTVVLADMGFEVIGYDIDSNLVNNINRGKLPFHEVGLEPLLKYHLHKKTVVLLSNLRERKADTYIICVGTPLDCDKRPDLTFIESASKQIGCVLKRRNMVISRSTVPVGTTRQVVLPILEKYSGLKGGEDFYLAFAPERSAEGTALEELRSLPQVIGGLDNCSVEVAANFFAHLNTTIVRVNSLEGAEMVKLINNAFRDLCFAFANELSLICDRLGLGTVRLIEAANEGYHRSYVPVPSPGVGGVCLKKDPYIFIDVAKKVNMEAQLSLIARQVNEFMPNFTFSKIKNFIKEHKSTAQKIKIFIIGFAFKGYPETSDLRGSTTLDLLSLLKGNGWSIFGYDPIVRKEEIENLGIKGCSLVEGFRGADCVIFMNNHQSYQEMDILGLIESMNRPAYFFDGWHIYSSREIERISGVMYGGLGGKN